MSVSMRPNQSHCRDTHSVIVAAVSHQKSPSISHTTVHVNSILCYAPEVSSLEFCQYITRRLLCSCGIVSCAFDQSEEQSIDGRCAQYDIEEYAV